MYDVTHQLECHVMEEAMACKKRRPSHHTHIHTHTLSLSLSLPLSPSLQEDVLIVLLSDF